MLARTLSILLLTLAACGSGGTKSAADASPPCMSPSDCLNQDDVCNPNTGFCDSNVACVTGDDALPVCGPGAFCTESGVCRPSGTGTPCAVDENCIGEATCQPESEFCGCDEEAIQPVPLAPRFMFVLDYSGSMGTNGIQQQTDAVNAMLAQHGMDKDFGIIMYPGPNSQGCVVEPPQVFPGPNTAGAIQAAMTGISAHGSTPLVPALEQIIQTDALAVNDPGAKVLVIISDGSPNCATNAQQSAINMVTQLAADNVVTYAVGIQGANMSFMNQLAAAGGTGSAFQTSNPQQLNMALSMIASSAFSCIFELPNPPEGDVDLVVSINGVIIPEASGSPPVQGWQFQPPNIIELYGTDCDLLQNGMIDVTNFVFGCKVNPE